MAPCSAFTDLWVSAWAEVPYDISVVSAGAVFAVNVTAVDDVATAEVVWTAGPAADP